MVMYDEKILLDKTSHITISDIIKANERIGRIGGVKPKKIGLATNELNSYKIAFYDFQRRHKKDGC